MVYNLGTFQYVYVETTNAGTLYYKDGTRYCGDRIGLNCRGFYGLNEGTVSGKIVESYTASDSLKLDLTSQPKGMYLLQLINNGKVQQHKLIKY